METLELEGDTEWRNRLENADLSTELERLERSSISIPKPIARDIEEHCRTHGEEVAKQIGDWTGGVNNFLGVVRRLEAGKQGAQGLKKPAATKGGESRESGNAKAGTGEEGAKMETASGPAGSSGQTSPKQ